MARGVVYIARARWARRTRRPYGIWHLSLGHPDDLHRVAYMTMCHIHMLHTELWPGFTRHYGHDNSNAWTTWTVRALLQENYSSGVDARRIIPSDLRVLAVFVLGLCSRSRALYGQYHLMAVPNTTYCVKCIFRRHSERCRVARICTWLEQRTFVFI